MDPFQLPDTLPTEAEALNDLLGQAQAYLAEVVEAFDEGDADKIAGIDPKAIDQTLSDIDTITSALAECSSDDEDHSAAVSDAVARARAAATASTEAGSDDETEDETDEAETTEGEPEKELATVGAGAAAGGSTSKPKSKPTFAGKGGGAAGLHLEEKPEDYAPAWEIATGAPGFQPKDFGNKVGFAELGKALDSCTKGGRNRLRGVASGIKLKQNVAQLSRGLKVVQNADELVAAIKAATDTINGQRITTEALVAAGGWCAPSEQIYTFCDIPGASDLISLPEIAIQRGGLRWPVEPDLSALFDSFEFFFTEPQLEAVDGNGDPTAIKHCVEIPCPDEFEELRLNAVGYCVEAGILQRQGWPESIEYVLRALAQEHLRAMSRRTILDMWNGGGAPKVFDAALQVGGTSGVLNALDLMATNIRLQKGYARTYPMEIVAPSWFFAALRADMAMMEGLDTKYVTDSTVQQWLTARNITGQFVGDWQTRDVTLPGHLDTLRWPGHVDIMMYPAGTWFRHLSNIIEVGVLYPKEQLQINRYTEFFTEDAIAVGKRCDRSVNLRIPLKINGGYGAPVTITHTDTDPDTGSGGTVGATPVEGGQADQSQTTTHVLSNTGTVSGGNFKLQVQGEKTATISGTATAAAVKAAIVALDETYADYVSTSGGPVGTAPVNVITPEGWDITLTDSAVTGGGSVALT